MKPLMTKEIKKIVVRLSNRDDALSERIDLLMKQVLKIDAKLQAIENALQTKKNK